MALSDHLFTMDMFFVFLYNLKIFFVSFLSEHELENGFLS